MEQVQQKEIPKYTLYIASGLAVTVGMVTIKIFASIVNMAVSLITGGFV